MIQDNLIYDRNETEGSMQPLCVLYAPMINKDHKSYLRSKTSFMLSCTEQPNGAEKSKSLRNPGPDDSHLYFRNNTGEEVGEILCLHCLSIEA